MWLLVFIDRAVVDYTLGRTTETQRKRHNTSSARKDWESLGVRATRVPSPTQCLLDVAPFPSDRVRPCSDRSTSFVPSIYNRLLTFFISHHRTRTYRSSWVRDSGLGDEVLVRSRRQRKGACGTAHQDVPDTVHLHRRTGPVPRGTGGLNSFEIKSIAGMEWERNGNELQKSIFFR